MSKIGKLYRIGELAKLTNVSKRTIDYYTKLGLLECQRSETNYRFYDEDAVNDLKFIERSKVHMTLDEIKLRKEVLKANRLDQDHVLKQVDRITKDMVHLESEIKEICNCIEKLDEADKKAVIHKLIPHSKALFQSLTGLIN
ncbi:MerR family transcriptional regulator [Bacillus sp. Marseille-P3661]|uniref:MerR family transcriptional regulator n=1 Tax=Bacillus sp. Marseille-P3661 TaxID=1936234 RepID=UPI0015E17F9D|nr:MerR family transcriptional regulator [Bacillus sp. Marseille-P3661]